MYLDDDEPPRSATPLSDQDLRAHVLTAPSSPRIARTSSTIIPVLGPQEQARYVLVGRTPPQDRQQLHPVTRLGRLRREGRQPWKKSGRLERCRPRWGLGKPSTKFSPWIGPSRTSVYQSPRPPPVGPSRPLQTHGPDHLTTHLVTTHSASRCRPCPELLPPVLACQLGTSIVVVHGPATAANAHHASRSHCSLASTLSSICIAIVLHSLTKRD
jgi:hypothetical protein